MRDSKALFVPYTEMICWLLFVHDSKALFVPDNVLACHDNQHCLCVLVKHCLCLILKHCLCLIMYLLVMIINTVCA